jgi:hypothetical protein
VVFPERSFASSKACLVPPALLWLRFDKLEQSLEKPT